MTDTFDPHDVILAAFPDDELDAMCISAHICDVIARALGMDPPEVIDGVMHYDDDMDDRLEEAARVLAALITAGIIRGTDFVYDDGASAAVHRD